MDFGSLLGGGGGGSKEFGRSEAHTIFGDTNEGELGPPWLAIVAVAGALLLVGVVVSLFLKRK
jgi:hypothetical protein